jgi:hypothetical protein
MLKPFITLSLTLISSLCAQTAYADIYEYIDEAGVAHYSDAPNNDSHHNQDNDNQDGGNSNHDNHRYVLILKSEEPVKSEEALKSEALAKSESALAETATDNNNTADNSTSNKLNQSTTLTPPQLLAHIQQSALNNQLDSELIHAVMHVESAYKIKAKSHKGAQGLMQLMPATAHRLGVKNSYDPAQNAILYN